MSRSRHSVRRALSVLAVSALAGVTGSAAASAAVTRYASTAGAANGVCTNPLAACDLQGAIASATSGDTVIVGGGVYPTLASTVLAGAGLQLDIHGDPASATPPVINSTALVALELDNPASKVSYLDVRDTTAGAEALKFKGAVAEQLLARSPASSTTFSDAACEITNGTLRDSVCVTTAGTAAIAGIGLLVSVPGGAASAVQVRNVTAVSPAGYGVVAASSSAGNASVVLANVIAHQGGTTGDDVFAVALAASSFVTTSIASSSFATADSAGSNANVTIGPDNLQATFAPQFVNPTAAPVDGHPAFDYHEAKDSPTIDKGDDQVDGSNGPLDFDRQARVQGGIPDIGGDEFVPPTGPGDPGTTTTVPVVSPPGVTVPVVTPVVGVPVVSKVSLKASKSSKFAVKPKGRFKKRKRVRYGATLRYTVSVAASVRGTVQVKTKGRLVGKSCKKQSKSNKKRKACVLYKAVLVLPARSAKVGASAVAFTGVVGKKKLKAGKYRLQLVATDAGKRVSKPVFVTFQIVKG